jgi:diguanylate cyclase
LHSPRLSFGLAKPATVFLLLQLLFPLTSLAAPRDIPGTWYQATAAGWVYRGQSSLDTSGLSRTSGVARTGGHYLFQADFVLNDSTRQVLDFKNTSIIGHFHHYVFDQKNRLVASLEGGIQSQSEKTFLLRHGQEIELPAGRYRLISELSSPFFLAQPEPYLDSLAHYRQAIRPGNALTLIGLGIFLGLGIYYTALMLARRRLAEGMYALFMLGNILFFSSALLVLAEFLGVRWIYLCSVPILLSNGVYILFVMALLEIRRDNHPVLQRAGRILLGVLGTFILFAALWPHWSLELARYGVGLFLGYGLTAGIVRARQGNVSARLYLIAVGLFFAFGAAAITQTQLTGVYTLYIEHVGLFAVSMEAILLALVLSYQFARLHHEKETALRHLEHSNRIAYRDALTGLANRFALDIELDQLPAGGSLTFIDLDRLKYYNDRFGHVRGDELLRTFSQQLTAVLGDKANIYRIGGDEFAVACPSEDVQWVECRLTDAVASLYASGFEFAGASAGSAHFHECSSTADLKHLADTRMYERKRKRKMEWLAENESPAI